MIICYNHFRSAGVAHLVERHLAKVEVASSSLVTRSKKRQDTSVSCLFLCDEARRIKCDADERHWRGLDRANPLLRFLIAMQTSLVTRSRKETTFVLIDKGCFFSTK